MTRLTIRRRLEMRENMHPRRVYVAEPRAALFGLSLHEIERGGDELLVDCFHTLFGQRAGVLDCLLADLTELRIDGRIVLVGSLAFENAARTELLPEIREIGR